MWQIYPQVLSKVLWKIFYIGEGNLKNKEKGAAPLHRGPSKGADAKA